MRWDRDFRDRPVSVRNAKKQPPIDDQIDGNCEIRSDLFWSASKAECRPLTLDLSVLSGVDFPVSSVQTIRLGPLTIECPNDSRGCELDSAMNGIVSPN